MQHINQHHKDSKEELDTDDFQTVYKKVSNVKYEEIGDKEYKDAAFEIYDIIQIGRAHV